MFIDVRFQFYYFNFSLFSLRLYIYLRLCSLHPRLCYLILNIHFRLYLLRLFHIFRLCALILYFNWKLYELCQNWMQMRLAMRLPPPSRDSALWGTWHCVVCVVLLLPVVVAGDPLGIGECHWWCLSSCSFSFSSSSCWCCCCQGACNNCSSMPTN